MTDYDILLSVHEPAAHYGVEIPEWIDQRISVSTVAAIVSGGYASRTYIAAMLHKTAAETMEKHGDKVLGFIGDCMNEIPGPQLGTRWSQMPVFYLSLAVELWAEGVIDSLVQAVADAEVV